MEIVLVCALFLKIVLLAKPLTVFFTQSFIKFIVLTIICQDMLLLLNNHALLNRAG